MGQKFRKGQKFHLITGTK